MPSEFGYYEAKNAKEDDVRIMAKSAPGRYRANSSHEFRKSAQGPMTAVGSKRADKDPNI